MKRTQAKSLTRQSRARRGKPLPPQCLPSAAPTGLCGRSGHHSRLGVAPRIARAEPKTPACRRRRRGMVKKKEKKKEKRNEHFFKKKIWRSVERMVMRSQSGPTFVSELQKFTCCQLTNTTHLTSGAKRVTSCGRSHLCTRRPQKETKCPLPCFAFSTSACKMRCRLVFSTFCLERLAMGAKTVDQSFTLSFDCVKAFTSHPVTNDVPASRRDVVHCSRAG